MDTNTVRDPAGQALVSDEAASHLRPAGFDPSRITEMLAEVEPKLLRPIIRKAADEFYNTLIETTEDWLRDNLDWNLKSHLSMLERENQRMRSELLEIDRTIGGLPLGHAVRLQSIGQNDRAAARYNELLWAVSKKYEGEDRHETALRYIRERDSDGSGEAGETAQTGSTAGDSAGRKASPTQPIDIPSEPQP